jgi:RHS repeat-associated protein
VDKTGSAYSGNYFLKDHLGSIRSTLKGGESVITDDFSGTLSQWSTVRGSGFAISGGALGTTTFSECILVSSTGKSIGDGSFTADVKTASSSPVGMGLVFRYQSTSSFYWVSITSSSVAVKKRVGGVDQAVGAAGSGVTSGVFNRFRVDLTTFGSTLTIQVYCNGVKKDSVQDNSPITAGPVGVIGGYGAVTWDNIVVTTNVTPGTVVSYDDLDAWGMVLEGRSGNSADGRQRFKFTGKERDTETKYDYLAARYYDARIARFMQFDPHGSRYANLSTYSYVGNNPLGFVDPSGMDMEVYINGDQAERATSELQKTSELKLSRDKDTGKLSASGEAKTEADKKLLAAIDDKKIQVHLTATSDFVVPSLVDGTQDLRLNVGMFDGSKLIGDKVVTSQFVNMDQAETGKSILGTPGESVLHEVLESYIGGQQSPGQPYGAGASFVRAHKEALRVYPLPNVDRITDGSNCWGVCPSGQPQKGIWLEMTKRR